MKRIRQKSKQETTMRPEYQLDYTKARRNRFSSQLLDKVVVVLEPDVAKIFKTSESVNGLLRSVISAIPKTPGREARKSRQNAS